MKSLLVATILLSSTSAFAISDMKLATKCAKKGLEKITEQADSYSCELKGTLKVQEIDNRFYNPFKYIWYVQEADCENGYSTVTSMVQYDSLSRECI